MLGKETIVEIEDPKVVDSLSSHFKAYSQQEIQQTYNKNNKSFVETFRELKEKSKPNQSEA